MNFAPIVLFVYNRPWHTQQTLEALKKNELAAESTLYIFADGPKVNATAEQFEAIKHVREIVNSEKWCKEVIVIERTANLGLAESVISGVTELVNRFGKVIVLEDDIMTSSGFLSFMNKALIYYKKEEKIAGISGFTYPTSATTEEVFFLPIGSSWGWATWKERWDEVNFDTGILIKKIQENNLQRDLDFGCYPFYNMLLNQSKGLINSWAIRFYASFFLQKKLFVYPPSSLVRNIGFDGSATHTTNEDDFLSKVILSNSNIELRPPLCDELTENVRNMFRNKYCKKKASGAYNLYKKIKQIMNWVQRAIIKRFSF
jgi:hypothetical protein